MSPTTTCTLGSNDVRIQYLPNQIDYNILIQPANGSTRSIERQPRTHLTIGSNGWGHWVACAPERGRIFSGQGSFGNVAAFDVTGRELWRATLPHFLSLEDAEALRGQTADAIVAALRDFGSLLTKVVVSGNYVLVESVTRRVETRQAVFHVSGRLIGVIGPWDGTVLRAIPRGWTFAFGNESETGLLTDPRLAVDVEVTETATDTEIDHFLAWVLPLASDDAVVWHRCGSLPPELVRFRLGTAYDAEMSRRTKAVHDRLDVAWFNDVLTRGNVSDVVADADVHSQEWVARFRAVLLQAGVDADYVRAVTALENETIPEIVDRP
jgi:hypothetical protein